MSAKRVPYRDMWAGGRGAVSEDRLVTVCSECLRASCWLGSFYCEKYRQAGTVQKSVRVLRELSREHEDYWL